MAQRPFRLLEPDRPTSGYRASQRAAELAHTAAIEVNTDDPAAVYVRLPGQPPVAVDWAVWGAFIHGAQRGEFNRDIR